MAWPGEPFHDSRFRDILRMGHVTTPAIDNSMRKLTETQLERYPNMEIKRWQLLSAATIMAGYDCFTITATGSGKSFCYQLVTLDDDGRIILIICPLVALMDEQVISAKRMGIRAAAVHAEALVRQPNLLQEIQDGKYQIILTGPEFCVPDNDRSMRLTTNCAFSEKLCCVIVDEAHLCHAWRGFRPTIDGLFRMRAWFKVPYMVLSATMTPYVRSYVHNSLRLSGSTPIIHLPVDRPEIYLSTRIAQHPLDSHKDLQFLFQDGMLIDDIVPTIVFADSRSEVCKLTEAFWDRAPDHWFTTNPFVFAELSSALSPERRSLVIQAVRRGLVRILFATQLAEVGLDFGNIYRVVQWKVPITLTAAGLWQRFGRACRRRGMRGVGILIAQPTVVISPGSDLQVLLEKPCSANLEKIMAGIHQHEVGGVVKASPLPHAWMRSAQPPFEVNPVNETRQIQRKRRRLDMPLNSQALLMDPSDESENDDNSEDEDFRINAGEDSDGEGSSSSNGDTSSSSLESSSIDVPIVAPLNIPDESSAEGAEGDILAVQEDHDDHHESSNSKRMAAVCRMILWLANTPGCIRECMMRYLDEADFREDNYAFPALLDRPCCDRHSQHDRLADELRILLPEYIFHEKTASAPAENSASGTESDAGNPRIGQLSAAQSKAIKEHLRGLRRRIWSDLGMLDLFSPYPSYHLLSDEAINTLAKKSAAIISGSTTVMAVLDIDAAAVAPDPLARYTNELNDAIETGWNAAPAVPPKRRGRPRRATPEFIPPFDINPHADQTDPEVQLALSQIEKARRAQDNGGQSIGQADASADSPAVGQGVRQSLRYADETGLHQAVKDMIGKRPKGRPSRDKIDARNAQIADALRQLGLEEEPHYP
jgi:superfamily II DNA/RNA helicase